MHSFTISAAILSVVVSAVSAADIWIQVGGNTSTNGSLVFKPERVNAVVGDTVWFNFTQGNHTATQSTFANPCIPAHETDITINGFDTSFRDAGNGTAVTTYPIPILTENVNETFWFYDVNTCGLGGVGAINNNESSNETLAGFVRNAIRLNGTNHTSTSLSASHTSTGSAASGTQTSASSSQSSSDAQRLTAFGGLAVLALAAVTLQF